MEPGSIMTSGILSMTWHKRLCNAIHDVYLLFVAAVQMHRFCVMKGRIPTGMITTVLF